MSDQPVRVVLVEDNDFTRTTLAGALRDAGFEVAGDADTATIGLRLVRRLEPDAVIIDLDLGPGPSGADLAVEVRAHQPQAGIVILTSYEDPRLAGRNVNHLPVNARYIVKSDLKSVHVLAEAVCAAVESARRAMVAPPAAAPPRSAALTDTQIEVVRLVAEGLSNAEIARRSHVSEKSVERTIMRAARELGIENTSTHNRRVLLARAYYAMTGGASSGA